jgi:hypothetical protein
VRHGNAMPEAGRTEAFAREQVVRDGRAGDAAVVLENQAGLFKGALLARHFQVELNVLEREDFA